MVDEGPPNHKQDILAGDEDGVDIPLGPVETEDPTGGEAREPEGDEPHTVVESLRVTTLM